MHRTSYPPGGVAEQAAICGRNLQTNDNSTSIGCHSGITNHSTIGAGAQGFTLLSPA